MKANKLFIYTAASFLIVKSLAPDTILTLKQNGRWPASLGPASEVVAPKIESYICKSELKGEKLEADVKKLLNDKEEIIKKVAPIKAETTENKSDNSELIALMSQMTTMISNQMQMQMQMQSQMFSMLSQMQTNSGQVPYANNYLDNNPNRYSVLNDNIDFLGSRMNLGLGIQNQSQVWSNYSNPYNQMPNMIRQQLPSPEFGGPTSPLAPMQRGFNFSQGPMQRGFDFSQGPVQRGFDFSQGPVLTPHGLDFNQSPTETAQPQQIQDPNSFT